MNAKKSKVKSNSNYKLKAADLFSGIGGIRKGFEQAFGDEIEFVFNCDNDKHAVEVYNENFRSNEISYSPSDITQIDIKNLPDFDILMAGFPCQAFSIAGNMKGFKDNRGKLFFKVAEILKEKRPNIFFLENVKNLRSHNKKKTFAEIRKILEIDLGYHIYTNLLNAKDFGVPQNRERIYIVGFKNEMEFEFPNPLPAHMNISNILEEKVNDNYILSERYFKCLINHKQVQKEKGNGFGYAILNRNQIANTLVCGGMGRERNLVEVTKDEINWEQNDKIYAQKGNNFVRQLTPLECLRVQGFPSDFIMPESIPKMVKYRLIANSVAIPVIAEIAKKIKNTIESHQYFSKQEVIMKNEGRFGDILIDILAKSVQIPRSGIKSNKSLIQFLKDITIEQSKISNSINVLQERGYILKRTNSMVYFDTKRIGL